MILALLEILSEDQAEDNAHQAGDHTTPESAPEIRHLEANAKICTDHTDKVEKQSVDQQGEKAQGKEDQGAGEEFQQWAQESVQQPKDQRQSEDSHPLSILSLDSRHYLDCNIKGDGINHPANEETVHN